MEHDTIAFICRVAIGLAIIAKIVMGLIQDRRDKKISVDIETAPVSGESQIFFLK